MQAALTVNGYDFARWAQAEGIQQYDILRQSREVVALDGTAYRAQVRKAGLRVALTEVRDVTLAAMTAALAVSPAAVTFTGRNGAEQTRRFYVTGPEAAEKIVRGGITYWSGVTFTLEEV